MQDGKPLKMNESVWVGPSYEQDGVKLKPSSVHDVISSHQECIEFVKSASNLKAGATAVNILALLGDIGAGVGLVATTGDLPISLLGCTAAYCSIGIPGLIVGFKSSKRMKEAVKCYNDKISQESSSFFLRDVSPCIEISLEL